MKIVVLDGFTFNPGDLDWEDFERIGELKVYHRTPAELTVSRSADAEALLTNKTVLGEAELSQLPLLEYIGVLATGYNIVDMEAASRRKITVTNVPGYSTDSVAQMVFAHLLNICQNVQRHSNLVKEGAWEKSGDFSFWRYPLIELKGKTMGIIGFGRIGRKVAQLANAFGMEVAVHSRRVLPVEGYSFVKWLSLEDLLKTSHVVTLHCPLLPETANLINRETISLMKKEAILINTARGPLINEADLAEALLQKRIAWAALDVLEKEPALPDNPLLLSGNCQITPHIGWATKAARQRLMGVAVENFNAYLNKKPVNVVEKP